MRVKAISLWEPWATSFVTYRNGRALKEHETRSWETKYRGPLVICAAKHPLDYLGRLLANRYGIVHLNYGMAVCIGTLVGCYRTESAAGASESDFDLGDWSPGRFAWHMTNVRAFEVPFPVTGHQGLFEIDVPAEVLA